jgi:hypothetical protein
VVKQHLAWLLLRYRYQSWPKCSAGEYQNATSRDYRAIQLTSYFLYYDIGDAARIDDEAKAENRQVDRDRAEQDASGGGRSRPCN